jgi:hypothetical protein
MTSLETAIAAGKMLGKTALYWGCWEKFPKVVARQKHPLILQDDLKGQHRMDANEKQAELAAQLAMQSGLAGAQEMRQTSKSSVRMWAAGLASELTKHGCVDIGFEAFTIRLVRFHETGSFDEAHNLGMTS